MDERVIERLLIGLSTAWIAADAVAFARNFTPDALFIAFDGSAHTGRDEIAAFHQQGFDAHLRDTRLILSITKFRPIAPGVACVQTRGGVCPLESDRQNYIEDSIQSLTIVNGGASPVIATLHNTRYRPIRDILSSQLWRSFDAAWHDSKV